MKISCDTKALEQKLIKLANGISSKVSEGLTEGLKQVQEVAYDYKGYSKKGILIEVTDSNNNLVGRVYTDKEIMPYAMFLEFGTGTFAELPHIGHTKTFIESGFRYWYLPVEKAQREFGNDRRIVLNGRQYYVMYAQEPKPFMRTAGFQAKELVTQSILKVLSEFIREVMR